MNKYDRDAFINFMITNIKPWAKLVSGGREINCRCFFCSDSENKNHGHMYISTGEDDTPIFFHCKKCNAKGVLTNQTLLDLGIYDTGVALSLIKHNKDTMLLHKNQRFNELSVYNIVNPLATKDNLSKYKLQYINRRIGSNLTFEDCKNLKICINLKDIINYNRLSYTRHENIIEQLDLNFIGFISKDNSVINMRNLDINKDIYEGINKRYINYNLIKKFSNTTRFYTIPTTIDLSDPRPIHLHIAEGPFDILSIFVNLRQCNLDRNVYTSIGGSNYRSQIMYFIHLLKFPNIIIHLYPDNDVSNKKLYYEYKDFQSIYQIQVHRNLYPNEKDFGVPIDRIQEQIQIM